MNDTQDVPVTEEVFEEAVSLLGKRRRVEGGAVSAPAVQHQTPADEDSSDDDYLPGGPGWFKELQKRLAKKPTVSQGQEQPGQGQEQPGQGPEQAVTCISPSHDVPSAVETERAEAPSPAFSSDSTQDLQQVLPGPQKMQSPPHHQQAAKDDSKVSGTVSTAAAAGEKQEAGAAESQEESERRKAEMEKEMDRIMDEDYCQKMFYSRTPSPILECTRPPSPKRPKLRKQVPSDDDDEDLAPLPKLWSGPDDDDEDLAPLPKLWSGPCIKKNPGSWGS